MSNNENSGEFLIYQTEDGLTQVQLKAQNGTVWLTQAEIAELLQTSSQNITLHIKSIYDDGELMPAATCKDYLQVRKEGDRQVQRSLMHYNLDMILAIGYRVRSARGTQFRRWATTMLKEYLVKGFVLNDERLKNPGGWDYFDILLERIRDIRTSEKRFYQKVRDIYATSIDYDSKSNEAQVFFKTVQNKMLWTVTNKTAAELIVERANADMPNMGLTSWQSHRVRKTDVVTAKNYLNHEELTELNNIVTMFLDFAADQAKRRQAMTMKNWGERLDAFLTFNDRAVLTHAGSISHEKAEQLAHERFSKFDEQRRHVETLTAEEEYLQELELLEKTPSQKSPKQIIVRIAVHTDIPMMQTFIFEHGKNPWNFLPEDEVKAHIAEITTKKVQAYLAEINGECVGFACFYLGLPTSCQKYEENQINKVAYLSEIVVHRDYAGQGIGSQLINALKEHLMANNITRLYAERHADNVGSSGVMAKTGFKIVDEYDDEQRRPTGSKKTVVTKLEL